MSRVGRGAGAELYAQERVAIEGRVVRSADTVPAPATRVVLHRLGREAQGAVDSLVTGANGRFRFVLPRDTAALYLVSARHQGIEYFSGAITLDDPQRPPPVTITVADTSSTTEIAVAARYLVIGAADTERRRTAVDLLVLRNAGPTTRVGRDSTAPVWSGPLPAGALGHQVAEAGSEISPDAVRFRGDTVDVLAPISPGSRQLLLEHVWPASATRITVPMGAGAGEIQVVTEEPGAMVAGAGVSQAESQVIDGRPLARWVGRAEPGQQVVVTFPAPGMGEGALVVGLVALTMLVAAVGFWMAQRRRLSEGRLPR